MRIITPTGKVHKVCNAVPYAEKKEVFNGRVHVNTEVAMNMSVKPTGIKLSLEREPNDFSIPSVYIGNLAPEKVQEILSALLKEGYYDFSKLEYQKVENIGFNSSMEIDGGKTLPFYQENICDNDIFSPSPFGGRVTYPAKEEEDFSEDELEEGELEEGDDYEE